ncbi:MAG: hypothetical protein KDA49_16130 [Rhodospirillaceae bacterium]|nr:hypothetical protein [Rhodospirillaceae bacterium]MCA8934004.1 hypothetical protein [Rhodospirillaceae bacterium]
MSLDRAEILVLLDKLGAESDADALAAARTLSQAISEADLSWDDLLLPPDMDDPPSFEDVAGYPEDDEDGVYDEDADEVADTGELGDLGEDHARLKRILDISTLSAETREDLIELEDALRQGEFTLSDRRYLIALEDRLR